MDFSEKILPNQQENKKLYDDDYVYLEKLYLKILESCQLNKFDHSYSFQEHKDFNMESMSVSPIYFSLLETLISIKPYKEILEIGSFLGATSVRLSNIIGKEDRYWANHVIQKNEKTLYDPISFEVDHHYTANGNTWKGVG